jgi:protein-S-isoprenylcysteine O-methyltransferase Ste14
MTAWYGLALIAGLGTMACFAGAIPLYFRKGEAPSRGKRAMLVSISVCGAAQIAAFFTAYDVAVPWRVAGVALLALAHATFWSAVVSHGRDRPRVAFATDVPRRLITTGPYRRVRHPFYLAYLVAWLAGAVVTASPWLVATAIAMYFVYRSAADAEEAGFLSSDLAGEYREYQQRTGMFIPKLYTGWRRGSTRHSDVAVTKGSPHGGDGWPAKQVGY